MKKNLILWGIAAILVLTALYVTKFNKGIDNTSVQSPPAQAVNASGQNSQSSSGQGAVQLTDPSVGQKPVDFTLTDLDGNKVTLSDLKGKSVYVNFWATWCPWCIKELPDIEKVYQEYKDKDLVVLAVDIGENKDTVSSFIQQNNFHLKVLLDSDQSVAQAYNISSIPVSIFIGKDGDIAAKRIGALSEQEMRSYVKQLTEK